MLEWINVTTLRTVPCPFLGVGVPFVNHFNNQMAVQTHCWFTVDILLLDTFPHVLAPFFEFAVANAILLPEGLTR